MSVRVHFIEHEQMGDEGISSVTVAAKPFVDHELYFANEDEFRRRCSAVEGAMATSPDDVHMIVICTHGIEDTGTWLCMGKDNDPSPLLKKPFSSLPAKTLVYLSICWGGYTANVGRMQDCGQKERPVVVGPLVPLWADEGDRLQDELLAVLIAHGLDDARLVEVVRKFNAELQDEFAQEAARIATRDGAYEPNKGAGGISWSLLARDDGRANEGPFVVEVIRGNRTILSDGVKKWVAPVGSLERGKKAKLAMGDRFTFKAKVHPKTNVLSIVNLPTLVRVRAMRLDRRPSRVAAQGQDLPLVRGRNSRERPLPYLVLLAGDAVRRLVYSPATLHELGVQLPWDADFGRRPEV